MILLKWLCYIVVTSWGVLIAQRIYIASNDTSGSRFKIGDRVALLDMFTDSVTNTGNHMPYHGEVLAVRRHHQFRYEYDVLPDFSKSGDYARAVFEHNLSFAHDADNPPVNKLTSSIDSLHKLK